MKRAKKIDNIAILAKDLFEKENYVISEHAKLKQGERSFNIGDIE